MEQETSHHLAQAYPESLWRSIEGNSQLVGGHFSALRLHSEGKVIHEWTDLLDIAWVDAEVGLDGFEVGHDYVEVELKQRRVHGDGR